MYVLYCMYLPPTNYLKEDKKKNASKEQKMCICICSAFPQQAELKDYKDKEEQHTKIQLFFCTRTLTFASKHQQVYKLPTNASDWFLVLL